MSEVKSDFDSGSDRNENNEKNDFEGMPSEESQQLVEETARNSNQIELSEETKASLTKLKYMIDHLFDDQDIINPLKEAHGATSIHDPRAEEVDKKLGNPDPYHHLNPEIWRFASYLRRQIFFHQGRINKDISRLASDGLRKGDLGIAPFWWLQGRTGDRAFNDKIVNDQYCIDQYSPMRSTEDFREAKSIIEYNINSKQATYMNGDLPVSYTLIYADPGKISTIRNYNLEVKEKLRARKDDEEIKYKVTHREVYAPDSIKPDGLMLSLYDINLELTKVVEGYKYRIQAAKELEVHMNKHNLDSIQINPKFPDSNVSIKEIPELIQQYEETIKQLEASTDEKEKIVLEIAKRFGELFQVPVFDVCGNLLWPEKISFEKIKQFISIDNETIKVNV